MTEYRGFLGDFLFPLTGNIRLSEFESKLDHGSFVPPSTIYKGVIRQVLIGDVPKKPAKRSIVADAIALAEIGGAGGAA